ncbi:MAG TPA: hypothetical protein VGL72_31075 [Bryobacteraceae bacterium]
MKSFLPLLLAAICAPAVFAADDPSGHWEATIKVPKGPSKLTLDMARDDKGFWTASLGVPENHATGLVVNNIKMEGNRMAFDSPDLPGDPAFDLTLRSGKLIGTLFLHGNPLPLEMTRTGDAKVELVPPSPSVSKDLAGDWEGALNFPNGDSRPIIFHFKNNLDSNTVTATLDSPAQTAFNLSLAGVVENANQVEFHVRIHGGSFKGTLDPEKNTLVGEWIQKPGEAPVPCKMRKN